MLIIKLGGSLIDSEYLSSWLDQLTRLKTQKICIVPGGGPFADLVREVDHKYRLNHHNAHAMAILAMQQYALVLSNTNPSYICVSNIESLLNKQEGLYIWLPYDSVMQKCTLPHSWEVTSDSLAVWLACQCEAEHLCLVKSHDVDEGFYQPEIHASLVDKFFPQIMQDYRGEISIYSASQLEQFVERYSHG